MRAAPLPWGETINLIDGDSTALALLDLAFILAAIAVSAVWIARLGREGGKRNAGFLAFGLGLLLAGIVFDFAVAVGFVRWLYMTETAFVALLVVVSLEVTDEVIGYSELRKTLQRNIEEKDILIKEIHHRVKNNLALLLGLLRLQSDDEEDERAKASLAVTMSRIYSIAQVHEMAYAGENLSSIDLSAYVDDIARSAIGSFKVPDIAVDRRSDSGAAMISVDLAVPLGLIVNEIVSNSAQHAFAGVSPKVIFHEERIEGVKDGLRLSLLIGDNGRGLRSGDGETPGLGTRLIEVLASQIDADIAVESEGGTKYRIALPLREPHGNT